MMNPLLIRTLRQEVRNRAFLGIYLALLAAGALTSAVVAASNDGERPGQILFVILSLASTGALWFYQPLTAYRAMAREREDDTWDLMELTGMSPGRIARGIVATSLVQGLFILAALAPFLAVAYLLRGVDAVTLVIFLAGALAGALSLGALATLLGCMGKTKATRTGLVSLLTIALLLLWMISWPIWIEVTRRSGIAGAIASNPLGGWLVVATTLWHILLAGGLCLILAMTLMTHRAGDRSRLPRIAVLVVAIDILLLLGGIAWFEILTSVRGYGSDVLDEAAGTAGMLVMAWIAITGFFTITEDEHVSLRQMRVIEQARGWRRPLTWILGPGAARGRVFFLAASLLAWIPAFISWQGTDSEPFQVTALIFGYAGLFLGLGDALTRTIAARWITTPLARRATLFGLVAGTTLLTSLLSIMIDDSWPMMFNPIMGSASPTIHHQDSVPFAWCAIVALVGGGMGTLWLVIGAFRSWIPRPRQTLASTEDRNPRGDG